MMTETKPCPFCGSTDVEVMGYEYFAVMKCWDCFAEGPQVLRSDFEGIGEAEKEAGRLWNERNCENREETE